MNFGSPGLTAVPEHSTKLCDIQAGVSALGAPGLQGDQKSGKSDGGSSGWMMEEALGTQRDKGTQSASTEGWGRG